MRHTIIILAILSLMNSSAYAYGGQGLHGVLQGQRELPVLDPARTVIVAGVIAGGNVTQLAPAMLKMAQLDTKKPIDIVIASPGGELVTGGLFANVMEAVRGKGVTVRCFVPTVAASMAFQLLLHCDQRYGLENAVFLWHGARIFPGNAPITQAVASQLAADLADTNAEVMGDLKAVLGKYISESELERHFELETLHTGKQLADRAPGFIEIFKYIPGLMDAMVNPVIPRNPEKQMRIEPGSIFHAASPDELGSDAPTTDGSK